MVDNTNQSTVNRRDILRAGVAVTSGVTITGCIGSGSGSGGGGGSGSESLHYLGRGGVTQEAFRELLSGWEEERGITVKHTSVVDDTAMMNRIEENPGGIDFCNPSSGGFTRGRSRELFAALNYDALPNYVENIRDPWRKAPFLRDYNDGTFRYISTQGLAYNTDQVDEFSTWDEIVREQYADSISLHATPLARFANAAAAAGVEYSKMPDSQRVYDAIIQKAREQDQNVFSYWTSGDQQMRFLREGQALISSAWGGRVRTLRENGYPIEYFIPEEGAVTHSEGYAIAQSSEKKGLVHELLNWVYQRDNLVELSRRTGYPAPIVNPPEAITSLYDYTEHPDDLVWIDWPKLLPITSDLQQDFNRIRSS